MAKSKTTDEPKPDYGRWARVRGSITRDSEFTTFRLEAQAYEGGPVWRQRVDVESVRLARVPGLYRNVLGMMVRDLAIQVER